MEETHEVFEMNEMLSIRVGAEVGVTGWEWIYFMENN